MIAVLIDATVPGSSGIVAVRHAQKVRVSGMSGGVLEIEFFGEDTSLLNVESEGVFDLPEGVERVRANVVDVFEKDRISIDLE